MSERLLSEFGSLKGILEAREEQLRKIDGLRGKTFILIQMMIPLIRTWERISMENRGRIINSEQAERYCKSLLMGLRNEQFYVICLNARCYILGEKKISEGSLSEVNAYPRVVLETALNYNAHSILLCHNHPGGTDFPSPQDVSSTITMQHLLKGVGIQLMDHIIVSGCSTYSMIRNGDILYK